MRYLSWLGLAVVALVATSCASGNYTAGTPSSRSSSALDFTGQWRLVAGRSDNGGDWFDERSRYGSGWGNTHGAYDRVTYGPWFLPDQFAIGVEGGFMSIEDDNGQPLATVDVGDGYHDGSYSGPVDERARWITAHRFEIERVGRGGRSIVQTFMLGSGYRELVVETRVDHDGETRTYTRVYERA